MTLLVNIINLVIKKCFIFNLFNLTGKLYQHKYNYIDIDEMLHKLKCITILITGKHLTEKMCFLLLNKKIEGDDSCKTYSMIFFKLITMQRGINIYILLWSILFTRLYYSLFFF